MKYLCLIYANEDSLGEIPGRELDAIARECVAYKDELIKSGQCVGNERLHSASAATTLRVRNGKVTISDGPYAETKEQLGGFYMIEARDLNEAIRIASKIPTAQLGCVEVRPVDDSPAV